MKKIILVIFLLLIPLALADNHTKFDEYCNRWNLNSSDCTLIYDMGNELISNAYFPPVNYSHNHTDLYDNFTTPAWVESFVKGYVKSYLQNYSYVNASDIVNDTLYYECDCDDDYCLIENTYNKSEVYNQSYINNILKGMVYNQTLYDNFAHRLEVPSLVTQFSDDKLKDDMDDFFDDTVKTYVDIYTRDYIEDNVKEGRTSTTILAWLSFFMSLGIIAFIVLTMLSRNREDTERM